MRAPASLLAALDEGPDELGQTVALHAASGVEEPRLLSLGEGDRRLLEVCRAVTGRDLDVVAPCSACGELSEATLSSAAVPPARPRMAPLGPGGGLREPTYADLAGLPEEPAEAVRALLERCVVGSPSRPPQPADLELVDDSLAGPLVLACPACGGPVSVELDVERAVLERLARRARELDVEIHLLASAYAWSLAEIESLSDERRRVLAQLVVDTA